MTIADLGKDFVAACDAVEKEEALLKELKKSKAAIGAVMVEAMLEEDMPSFKVDTGHGLKTVHLRREIVGSLEKTDDALAAFRAAGGDDLIKMTVNPSSFKAWFKEQIDDDADPTAAAIDRAAIPDELRQFVKVFEKTEARVRKG